jgi:hypothetical protein
MSDQPTVKPTPTQDELDRHARGERITEHEPDGSPVQQSANAGQGHPHPAAAAAAAAMGAPDGMNYNPPSERQQINDAEEQKRAEENDKKKTAETKSSEANKARADYKTRDLKTEKSKDKDD